MEHRLAGVFEEALVSKVRPGPAAMDPVLIFAAFLSDRRGPAVLLDSDSALVAGALGAKSAGQAWCQWSGQRQGSFPRLKHRYVGRRVARSWSRTL